MKKKARKKPVCKEAVTFHNYFTVTAGGKTIKAFNEMLDASAVLRLNRPYAEYIVLGSGGGVTAGKLNGVVYAAPVRLTEINPDREKGELRAEYGVTIDGAEGLNFCELALCTSRDGSGAVNLARVEPVSYSGETVAVTVTIFAETEGEVQIVGGDNPVARWLLGCGSLTGDFTMATGECNYPQLPMTRLAEGLSAAVPAQVEFGPDALRVTASVTGEKNEFAVLLDGKPVLRLRPAYAEEILTRVQTTTNARTFLLPDPYPLAVMNVFQGEEAITDARIIGRARGLYGVKDLLPFRLGKVSALKNDPEEEYLAAINENEVILMRVTEAGARITMRVKRTDEYAEVLTGGGLALWGGDALRVYEPGADGAVGVRSYPVGKGSQNAVTREGAALHAARITGGSIERYRVDASGMALIDTQAVEPSVTLIRRLDRIAWINTPSGGIAKLGGLNAMLTKTANSLYKNFKAPDPLYAVSDYMLFARYGQYRRVMDYVLATFYPVLSDGESVAIGGRALIRGTETRRTVSVYDPSTARTAVVRTETPPFDRERCMTVVGPWLIRLMTDGTVRTEYIDAREGVLFSPNFGQKTSVSYIVRKRVLPFDAQAVCRAEIRLQYKKEGE